MTNKLIPIFIVGGVIVLGGIAYLYQSGSTTPTSEYSMTPPPPAEQTTNPTTGNQETSMLKATGNVDDTIAAIQTSASAEISVSENEDQDADAVVSDGEELKNFDQVYDENSL